MAIDAVKPNKAPGPDKIPGDLLRQDTTIWGPYVNYLCNAIAAGSPIPESWKGAEIVTILKKGNHYDPANYRPISLLDILRKMYSRQILMRLNCWLDENDIL